MPHANGRLKAPTCCYRSLANITDTEGPNQYDGFGFLYDGAKVLPASLCEQAGVDKYVGGVQGLRVLDLACGNGDYSRKMVAKGAAHVTGVDLSPGMIEAARKQTESPNISYLVGDCSKPIPGVEPGSYDLVMGIWLLNYATNEKEMISMWRNISTYLRPGGLFVGIVPNFEHIEYEKWYGMTSRVLEYIPNGCKRQVTIEAATPITFVNYSLDRELYERSAQRCGMTGMTVHDVVLPAEGVAPWEKGMSEEDKERFWGPFKEKPTCNAITAKKEL